MWLSLIDIWILQNSNTSSLKNPTYLLALLNPMVFFCDHFLECCHMKTTIYGPHNSFQKVFSLGYKVLSWNPLNTSSGDIFCPIPLLLFLCILLYSKITYFYSTNDYIKGFQVIGLFKPPGESATECSKAGKSLRRASLLEGVLTTYWKSCI